jgi:hypothetical protein
MLETIQEMKFFLRTAYGDSKTFAGSSIEIKTQGLGQGNGASPAGWCVISIVILWAHGAKSHGAQFIAPMSLVRRSLSAILYVDDMDLLHISMDTEESIAEVHTAIQWAIENWGRLLIATGETLKPKKCFYHLIDFAWTQKGGGNTSHIMKMSALHCSSHYRMGQWPRSCTSLLTTHRKPSVLPRVPPEIALAVSIR